MKFPGLIVFVVASLSISGCQSSPPADPHAPDQYDIAMDAVDEHYAPYVPDDVLRRETINSIVEVHRRNPWITSMPTLLKAELRECFRARAVAEGGFGPFDTSPEAVKLRTGLVVSYYDALGSRQFSDFDAYCPGTVAQVQVYVP